MKRKLIIILSSIAVMALFVFSLTQGFFVKADDIYEINVKDQGSVQVKVVEGKQTAYQFVMPKNTSEIWHGTIEADESLGLTGELLESLNNELTVTEKAVVNHRDVITFEATEPILELAITATQQEAMFLDFEFEQNDSKGLFRLDVEPDEETLLGQRLSAIKSVDSIPEVPAAALDIDLEEYFGIVGDASVSSQYPNTLIPVPDAGYQKGAMWSQNQINLAKDFSMEMFVFINEVTGDELADGITITFHNDERGVEAIGGSGGGIGAYPLNWDKGLEEEDQYVHNAISVEFDPYLNDVDKDDYDDHKNINGQSHIAVVKPRDRAGMKTEISRSHAEFAMPITNVNFDSPQWNVVTTYWTAATETLRVGFEELQSDGSYQEVAAISADLKNHRSLFGGDYVHWGATGSTGGKKGAYYLAMKKMPEIDLGEPVTDVINLTKKESFGSIGDNSETVVEDGDKVKYRLSHTIEGNNTVAKLKNYTVTDELPAGLSYVKGTTTYSHYNSDTGVKISEGKVADKNWNKNELSFTIPEDVREDSEIIIHFEAEFSSSTYKKEELINSWAYTTTNGYGQYSSEATIIKEREKYEVIEYFVDNETEAVLQKEEESLLDIEKNGKTYFSREPEFIEGYELERYTYEMDGEIVEVEVTGDELIKFEVTDDVVITYYYRLADFSPRVHLRTKNNQLVIHYRNLEQLIVNIDGDEYQIIDVPTKMSDEALTIPVRIDSDRTKVTVQGKLEGEIVATGTLNSQK